MMVRRRQDPICKFLPSHRIGVREVPIRIVIARPDRRSRTGTERIWTSSSVALDDGVAAISRISPSRVGRKWMSI